MSVSTTNQAYKNWKYAGYALSAVLLLLVFAMGVSFFERWPIENTTLAIDWQSIWPGLKDGQINYRTGMFIAPWSAVFVFPLGLLSLRSSWGVITLLTMAVLIVSTPRHPKRWVHWLTVLLLVLSFPSLRHTADGNFEGLIIAGTLLLVYGYRVQSPPVLAVGILLATAKIQESWLLMAILGIYLLRAWPRRKLVILGVILGIVVGLSWLWIGQTWVDAMLSISQRNSIMDNSLTASLLRVGFNLTVVRVCWVLLLGVTVYVCLRAQATLSREKAAMLIAVSLLLSPYAAGNSFLTILAVGIIPTFLARPRLGIADRS